MNLLIFDENSLGYEVGKFSGWFFGDVQGEVAEIDQDILFFESVTQIDGNLQKIIQEKQPGIYVRENAYQPFEKIEDV
ncbi:MAG: hypothetical protein AAGH88_16570 [Planctomycetota bacterium]